jgi:hypothetical protein
MTAVGRIDWHELSRRAGPPFLVFVLITWAGAWHLGAGRPEPDLYPFLKRSWPGADFQPMPGGAFTVRRSGTIVGYAAYGTAAGYGGPITMAVGATPDGRVRSVAILEYRDTLDLLPRSQELLRSLLGKTPDAPFHVGDDVDAVSGATFSSRAIALASLEAARAIAERGVRQATSGGRIEFGPPEIALLALLLAGAVGRNRPHLPVRVRRALRIGTLLVSLATIGFLFNRPWVIAFPTRLLAGDFPSWRTHLYWYIHLAGLLVAFTRTGKNAYCPWICPFGAAQDVIGLAGGARRRRMPSALLFTWVKRVLLWVAVLLGLLYRNPGAASFEVFAAFFRLTGTEFQFAILVFTIGVGVFVSRPFCHWVCPVDTTEHIARAFRLRLARLLGVQPARSQPRRPIRLAVVADRPAADPLRRLRNGLITAVGLLCAVLVVAHLATRFAAQSEGEQENLMGASFVMVDGVR